MARPREGALKSRVIHVRLTLAEVEAFDAAVKKLGAERSRVVRRAMREIVTGGPDLFDDGLEEFSRLRIELRAIGRNLNQITRAINSGDDEDLRHIEAITEAVSSQVSRIEDRVTDLLHSTRHRWVRVLEGGPNA